MSTASRRARSKFYKMITDFAETLEDDDPENAVDLVTVTDRLQAAVADDPDMLAAWSLDQAALMVERHDRAMRPKPGDLFPDLKWAPVAENKRVKIGKMSISQIQLWGTIDDNEFANQAEAHARKSKLRSEWVQKWLLPENRRCKQLRDLWKRAYGWKPPAIVPEPESDVAAGA